MGITVTLPEPKPKPTRRAKPTPPPQRPAVLVVVNPDQYIEVFTSPGVHVHIAEALKVEPAEEILAEQYLEMTLPLWARQIFFPARRVAALMPKPRTAGEEYWRRTKLGILDIVGNLEGQPKPYPVRIVERKP